MDYVRHSARERTRADYWCCKSHRIGSFRATARTSRNQYRCRVSRRWRHCTTCSFASDMCLKTTPDISRRAVQLLRLMGSPGLRLRCLIQTICHLLNENKPAYWIIGSKLRIVVKALWNALRGRHNFQYAARRCSMITRLTRNSIWHGLESYWEQQFLISTVLMLYVY